MGNKIIGKDAFRHYYESDVSTDSYDQFKEPDKSKSISELTRKELWDMLSRLRDEKELQRLIRDLKRNSGERESFEQPFKIDTTTPINQMYHHGVVGMKWGVRRYQNKDGTRTSAGKRRDRQKKSENSQSEDHKTSRTSKSKATSGLSNDELRKLNERLQLEENYKRLTTTKMQKSESWVKKAITNASEQALTEFSKGIFLGGAKLLVKELSPEFAEVAFKLKDKEKKD